MSNKKGKWEFGFWAVLKISWARGEGDWRHMLMQIVSMPMLSQIVKALVLNFLKMFLDMRFGLKFSEICEEK